MLRKALHSFPTLQGRIALLTGFMSLHFKDDPENPEGGSGGQGARDPLQLTEREWRDREKLRLADTEQSKLIDKLLDAQADNRRLRQRETPEGSKVLTAEEAKDYAAYLLLGKPADLDKAVKDGQAAVTELGALKAQGAIQSAAKAAGADETVLQDRLTAAGLTAETRDVTVDGKPVSQVFLKDAAGKDLGELRAYTEANWKPYTAALFPTATEAAKPAGTVLTPQAGAGATGTAGSILSPVEARIQARTQATTGTTTGGTT